MDSEPVPKRRPARARGALQRILEARRDEAPAPPLTDASTRFCLRVGSREEPHDAWSFLARDTLTNILTLSSTREAELFRIVTRGDDSNYNAVFTDAEAPAMTLLFEHVATGFPLVFDGEVVSLQETPADWREALFTMPFTPGAPQRMRSLKDPQLDVFPGKLVTLETAYSTTTGLENLTAFGKEALHCIYSTDRVNSDYDGPLIQVERDPGFASLSGSYSGTPSIPVGANWINTFAWSPTLEKIIGFVTKGMEFCQGFISSDGLVWDPIPTSFLFPVRNVIWFPAGACFVATTLNNASIFDQSLNNAEIYSSPDGLTWQLRSQSPYPVASLGYSVNIGQFTHLLCTADKVYAFAPNMVLSSTDGVTWTAAPKYKIVGGVPVQSLVEWDTSAYSPTLNRWVFVNREIERDSAYSDDLVNFTFIADPTPSGLTYARFVSVAYSPAAGAFFAVAGFRMTLYDAELGELLPIYRSYDGITWAVVHIIPYDAAWDSWELTWSTVHEVLLIRGVGQLVQLVSPSMTFTPLDTDIAFQQEGVGFGASRLLEIPERGYFIGQGREDPDRPGRYLPGRFSIATSAVQVDLSSTVGESSQRVRVWYDQSGRGRHALRPEAGIAPHLQDGLVSFPEDSYLDVPEIGSSVPEYTIALADSYDATKPLVAEDETLLHIQTPDEETVLARSSTAGGLRSYLHSLMGSASRVAVKTSEVASRLIWSRAGRSLVTFVNGVVTTQEIRRRDQNRALTGPIRLGNPPGSGPYQQQGLRSLYIFKRLLGRADRELVDRSLVA